MTRNPTSQRLGNVSKFLREKLSSSTSRKSRKNEFRRAFLETLEERRLLARQVSGTLSADDIWSGTIQVTGDVTVPNNVQLTIAPGTVVKFNTAQSLRLNNGSTLQAIGTTQSPITFTSSQDDSAGEDLTGATVGAPLRGHWEAIYIDTSTAIFENAEVRYAGNWNAPGDTYPPYRIPAVDIGINRTPVLRNFRLSDSDWIGINVQGNATLDNVAVERASSIAIIWQRSKPSWNPSGNNLWNEKLGLSRIASSHCGW